MALDGPRIKVMVYLVSWQKCMSFSKCSTLEAKKKRYKLQTLPSKR